MIKNSDYFKQFFFNTYMKKGKKSKSEKIYFNLYFHIQENRYKNLTQTKDFKKLVYSNAPILTVRRKKFGRFYRQIPFLLSSKASLKLPIKFLFKELNDKKNLSVTNKKNLLLKLLINLNKKRGNVYQNVVSLKKEASKNKRNYKYQW